MTTGHLSSCGSTSEHNRPGLLGRYPGDRGDLWPYRSRTVRTLATSGFAALQAIWLNSANRLSWSPVWWQGAHNPSAAGSGPACINKRIY